MMRAIYLLLVSGLLFGTISDCTAATPPRTLSYQGKLADNAGRPVNDTCGMEFRLFAAETGGPALWTQTQSTPVAQGVFTVSLGPVPEGLVENNGSLWVEIVVNGTTLSPRTKLASAPYALLSALAQVAETVPDNAITSAKIADGSVGASDLAAAYSNGSAYDSRFVRKSGDTISGNLTVTGTLSAALPVDTRYLRDDLATTAVQVVYGDIDVRSGAAPGTSYLHPGATDARNWGAVASQVFCSRYYYGPNSTDSISIGEANPVNIQGTLAAGTITAPALNDTTAGYYVDPGGASVVNDLTVNGSVSVPAGKPNLPIAYAFIGSDGTKASGTSNVSCTWDPTSSGYEITIAGETYFYSYYATTVTPLSSKGVRTAATNSLTGKLLVYIYDESGSKVQSSFQFVTYKP